MPRITNLAESGVLTENMLLKTAEGYLFSVTIAWSNQTAGSICGFHDGTDATGPYEVVFALPSTSGIITKEWPQGKKFDTGIFWDEGSQELLMECTFK